MDIRFDDLPRAQWETFCDASRAPLQQRWDYGETFRHIGGTVLRASLWSSDTPIGVAQVLVRHGLCPVGLLNRGPIWYPDLSQQDQIAARDTLHRVLRRRGLRLLVTTPPCDRAPQSGLQLLTSATWAAVDLERDLRAALHGKWRNRLVRAEASGLSVKCLNRHHWHHDWLLTCETQQRQHRRYRALPRRFSDAWLTFAHKQTLTLIASHRGAPIAGMMFLCHGQTATYHVGWTSPEGRSNHAHTLLMWRAMTTLQKQGTTMLDLGLLNTVQTPGLARFKLGTGAEPRRLGPTTIRF